jgi:hypothetical protein
MYAPVDGAASTPRRTARRHSAYPDGHRDAARRAVDPIDGVTLGLALQP